MKKNKILLLTGTAICLLGSAALISDGLGLQGIAYAQHASGQKGQGQQGARGGHDGAGQKGGTHSAEDVLRGGHDSGADHESDEDSDRPDWAGTPGRDGKPGRGNATPGTAKGDLFGDMYVILRDENGVPTLSEDGFVQPIDSEGNLIPLDDEGHPLDENATVEVELGRLNVGRSPSNVLSSRLDEAVANINQADSISLDAAGRIVYTVDGTVRTIDSPLENLALYVKLMEEGSLGLSLDESVLGDLAYLNDDLFTQADVAAAASFLAGASDKYAPLQVDSIVYLNSILGIDGTIEQNGIEYVDYSNVSYDRSDVYADAIATILVETSEGVYEEQTVNLYEAVFDNQDYTSISGIDGFAQAADDARAVIAFVHDNEAP